MSGFGTNYGATFSPWENGIPPCFVNQPLNYVAPKPWVQNSNFNNRNIAHKRVRGRKPLASTPPAAKKMRTDSALQVTIKGQERGRVVNRNNNAAAPAPPPLMGNTKGLPFGCFVCNRFFGTDKGYLQHMSCETHLQKEKIKQDLNNSKAKQVLTPQQEIHPQKKKKKKNNLKAKQALAQPKITLQQMAGSDERIVSEGPKPAIKHFCRECQIRFTCSVIEHKQTPLHKQKKSMARPYCAECEMFFQSPQKFVKHCKNAKHGRPNWTSTPIGKDEATGSGNNRRDDDLEADEADMSQFVTVDEVGYENSGDEDAGPDEMPSQLKKASAPERGSNNVVVINESFGDDDGQLGNINAAEEVNDKVLDSYFNMDGEAPAKNQPIQLASVPAASTLGKPSSSDAVAVTTVEKEHKLQSESMPLTECVENVEPLTKVNAVDATIEFPHESIVSGTDEADSRSEASKPGSSNLESERPPIGLSFVTSISGLYCKICNEVFRNEPEAKCNHCKSEEHYLKFKAISRKTHEARPEDSNIGN